MGNISGFYNWPDTPITLSADLIMYPSCLTFLKNFSGILGTVALAPFTAIHYFIFCSLFSKQLQTVEVALHSNPFPKCAIDENPFQVKAY